MLTSTGLVNHVKKALTERWGYVWGTFGQILSLTSLTEKLIQYPEGVGRYEGFIRLNYFGKRTADCVGLIKSYMWWTEEGPVYNPSNDVSANKMFELSREKGTINSFPSKDIPGLCLWKDGHIGVYIGDGQVIEARGTKYGVIQTSLKGEDSAGWTHWMKCPYITYDSSLRKGSVGEDVKDLQTKLNKIGYSLVIDGMFGPGLETAVINFQENNSLIVDGIVGPLTLDAINKMVTKVSGRTKKTYLEIIKEVSVNDSEEWIKSIDAIVEMVKTNSDLGALEIFQHLPTLIENICMKYSKK